MIDIEEPIPEEEEMLDLGIQRLVEHLNSGQIETVVVDTDHVLAEFDLTRKDLEKVPDNELED